MLAFQIKYAYNPCMKQITYTDVVAHFGNESDLARALEVKPQAVYQWAGVVPRGRAFEIEVLTQGKMKALDILAGCRKTA